MLGGLGWADPTNWAGLSPKKGWADLGPTKSSISVWARVSLAHKHIRNGPEPAWPSERNPSVLGQNQPGPTLENQPVGGIIFPPSSCMQNERSACRRKT